MVVLGDTCEFVWAAAVPWLAEEVGLIVEAAAEADDSGVASTI